MVADSDTNQIKGFNKVIVAGSPRLYLSKSMLALAAVLILAGCSNDQQSSQQSSTDNAAASDSISDGVLRVGTEGAYAPFNYTNTDGTLGGFDIEIANALCADMRVRCEIIAQDWDGIIPGLKAGKYDAIVAAMSITPERAEQVSFSDPYFSNTLVFLAKQNSSFDPSDPNNIDATLIAAQRSTISSQWLEEAYPKTKIKLYDTLSNAFLDLGANRVEAMISDKLPALQWLRSSSGSDYVLKGNEIDINDNFAVAVRSNDPLQATINKSLANIKANGTYDEINQRYFATPVAGNSKVSSEKEANAKNITNDASSTQDSAAIEIAIEAPVSTSASQ